MAIDPNVFDLDEFSFPLGSGSTPSGTPPATPSEVIVGRLLATEAVTDLVGQRVAPNQPDDQDSEGAYIVIGKRGGGGGLRLDNTSGLKQYLIRVDCYAVTEAEAEAIMFAVTETLDGWVDDTIGVPGCFAQSDQDEAEVQDSGGGVFQVSGQTFGLWYRS